MLFAESFDPYATFLDATTYWDSINPATGVALVIGRSPTGRAARWASSSSNYYAYKNSGANDPVHHLNVAFRQEAAFNATTIGLSLTLGDGALAQTTVAFRQDGAIVLLQGFSATVLATWTNAFTMRDQWFYFEIEIVISDTAGSIKIRRNGNKTTDDFAQSGLNTRFGSANPWANRLTVGQWSSVSYHIIDDLMWRSDPTVLPWIGDVRPWPRAPVSDGTINFARTSTYTTPTTTNTYTTTRGPYEAYYQPWIAPASGTISAISVNVQTFSTNHTKLAVYASSAPGFMGVDIGRPDAVLQSADAPLADMPTGINTFTFTPPLAITKGTQYFIAIIQEVSQSNTLRTDGTYMKTFYDSTAGQYATFPRPGGTLILSTQGYYDIHFFVTMNVTTNAACVSELQNDGATSYVYSPNPGESDLYNIASLPTPPGTTVAVITRGFFSKSDNGSRQAAIQLKSGGVTVRGPDLLLPSVSFAWSHRIDVTNPNGSIPWTNGAIDALQIGPVVTL
jgi:hypothetical protein